MRTFLTLQMMIIMALTILPANVFGQHMQSFSPNAASDSVMTVKSYTGSVEVKKVGEIECKLSFDITCTFELSGKLRPTSWNVASNSLKATYAEMDGRPVGYDTRAGNITIALKQDLGVGQHTIKLKYSGNMCVFSPERARYAIYAGPKHFHLFGNWFPTSSSTFEFSDMVRFDVGFEIPKDWLLIGYCNPKNRTKPAQDGKYTLTRDFADPMRVSVVGGNYSIRKETVGDGTVWAYTLQDSTTSFDGVIGKIKDSASFFNEYFDMKASGEFIVAETTGMKDSCLGTTFGLLTDSASLTNGLSPDMIAQEVAKMSWFGGNGVIGSSKKPDFKIYSESFPIFAGLLYCDSKCPPDHECPILERNIEDYYRYRSASELPASDPKSSPVVTELRTPLVLNALKAYVTPEIFQKAMRDFIKKYSLGTDKKTRTRPTLVDFKRAVENAYDESIDPFWNFFIKTNSVFDVDFRREAIGNNGNVTEKIYIAADMAPPFPLSFRLYYADGTSEDLILSEKSLEKTLDKPAGGIDFIDRQKIISSPNQIRHTMASSTIQAACTWKKPIVYCEKEDDSQSLARAQKLSEMFGCEIMDAIPDVLPQRPIIITGEFAKSQLALNALKDFPIKCEEDTLRWSGKSIPGKFSMFALVPDKKNPNTPIIIDTGIGKLPDDFSKAIYIESENGLLGLSLDYLDSTGKRLPEPELLEFPWVDGRMIYENSIYSLPPINLDGCTLTYSGFDIGDFAFKTITKQLQKDANNTIMLNFENGRTNLCIDRKKRFVSQTWSMDLICGKTPEVSEKSLSIVAPKAVEDESFKIMWSEPLQFLSNIDGKTIGSWQTGTLTSFDGLESGSHTIKLIFLGKDGLLSPIIERTVITGAKQPKLVVKDNPVTLKNGTVTITGITDPGCIIEPPAQINPDGSFTIFTNIDKSSKSVTVTSTNHLGLTTSIVVRLQKVKRVVMTLGSTIAKDEDGNEITLSAPPLTLKGYSYVPMRFLGEWMGASIEWTDAEKKITYKLKDMTIELWIGRKTATINGKLVPLDAPPVIVQGRTLVPVRFVSEVFGVNVFWKAETKQIILEYLYLIE